MDHSSGLKIVQVNFLMHQILTDAARQATLERAEAIAQISGLYWKIWTYKADTDAAGGVYLFHDEASAQAYLNGPIFGGLAALPGVTQMQVNILDVNLEMSAVTRAPLSAQISL